MPELNLNFESLLGSIDSNASLKNNKISINYNTTTSGVEKIDVLLNNKSISFVMFKVDVPELDKIYVGTTGSDMNLGTKNNPLRTIATAIRKNKELGGNKIIIILSGIYSFSLKIFTI